MLSGRDGPPVGVARRDWNQARSIAAAGITLGLIGLMTLAAGAAGLAGLGNEATPVVPLSEAAERTGPARLQGRLRSPAPVTMPDDGAQVISGRLRVTARFSRPGKPAEERVLIEWSANAPEAFLTDGQHRVPLSETAALVAPGSRSMRARIEREPGRNGRPLAVLYGERRFPLEVSSYGVRVSASVERHLASQDAPVVVTGALRAGALGPGPSGDIRLRLGTLEEQRASDRRLQLCFVIGGPLLALAGVFLAAAGTVRQRRMRGA